MNGCGGFAGMMPGAVLQSADSGCVSVPVNQHQQQLVQEPVMAELPPLLHPHVPTAPPHNMLSALPFFNVMIPVADNFGGPVNMSVSPSVDPSGSDLPINGKSLQSNPLKWLAMGPGCEYPLGQSIHLSMFYTLYAVSSAFL